MNAWTRTLSRLVPRRYREEVLADLIEEHDGLRLHWEIIRAATAARWHEESRRPAGRGMNTEDGGHHRNYETMMRRGAVLGSIKRDVVHAFRSLVRAPRFTIAAVATLALGIGATSAVFTVVDGVMLRPLPFPEAERVTQLAWERGGGMATSVPYYKVHFWRDRARAFDALTTYANLTRTLGESVDEATPIRALGVDHEFFPVVGYAPVMGRALGPEDQRPGGDRVAILAFDLWQSLYGGDPGVLGRSILLSGTAHTVVGVMGDDFEFPYVNSPLHVLVPLGVEPNPRDETENFPIIARLASGVGPTQAGADLERVWAEFQQEHSDIVNDNDEGMTLASFQQVYVGSRATVLWVLAGAIAMVLLIACANVASLLMARTTERRREMAVRSALGASRGAITRHLMTESLVLAAVGGALGVAAAGVGVDALLALNPDPLPRTDAIGVDGRVLAFTSLISVLTAFLFGLPAALPASRAGGPGTSSMRATSRVSAGRRVLIGGEAALSMMLLFGAGLLVTTFVQLTHSDPGYDPGDVVSVEFPGIARVVPSVDALAELESRVEAALLQMPDVDGVAWTSSLPLERGVNLPIGPDNRPDDVIGATEWRAVSPGYIEALDMQIVAGRDLVFGDLGGSQSVALVNETFARHFFAGDAVGEMIAIGRYRGQFIAPGFEGPPSLIVGVVADQRDVSLRSEARATVFVPRAQVPSSLAGPGKLMIEGRTDRIAVDQLLAGLERVAPELPTARVSPLSSVVAASLMSERFHAVLLGAFALLALLLTALGIAGVVSYDVRRRRREIGIRMALGAGAGRVVRGVTVQGIRPVLLGLAVGIVGSLFLMRPLSSLLWGVTPTDPRTMAAVAVTLSLVALVASWIPARGAAGANPVDALRID